jgi:hypothetical protein
VAAEKINKGDFIIEYIGEGNLFYLTFAYILSSQPFFSYVHLLLLLSVRLYFHELDSPVIKLSLCSSCLLLVITDPFYSPLNLYS